MPIIFFCGWHVEYGSVMYVRQHIMCLQNEPCALHCFFRVIYHHTQSDDIVRPAFPADIKHNVMIMQLK